MTCWVGPRRIHPDPDAAVRRPGPLPRRPSPVVEIGSAPARDRSGRVPLRGGDTGTPWPRGRGRRLVRFPRPEPAHGESACGRAGSRSDALVGAQGREPVRMTLEGQGAACVEQIPTIMWHSDGISAWSRFSRRVAQGRGGPACGAARRLARRTVWSARRIGSVDDNSDNSNDSTVRSAGRLRRHRRGMRVGAGHLGVQVMSRRCGTRGTA